MSPSRSTAAAADLDPEFDVLADELYALRPDAFAAARDEHVRKARAEGRQALARELGRLRKPTQSAWLINLLWRDQREVMEQLFELALDLSRAQAEAAGPELRALTTQRRELEAALLRRANALAEQAGVRINESVAREAQETLAAALASPELAEEVRTGRLVKPASYAGFGVLPAVAPAVTRAASVQPQPIERAEDKAASATREAKLDEVEARAAQRARERREAAERRLQEARAALEAAAATLADRERDADAAQQHHQELRTELEQLERQLKLVEDQVAAAERAALAAVQRRDEADKARAAALRTFEQAEQDLTEPAS